MKEVIADVGLARLVLLEDSSLRIEKDQGYDTLPPSQEGENTPLDRMADLAGAAEGWIKAHYQLHQYGKKKAEKLLEGVFESLMNAEHHGNKFSPGKRTTLHHSFKNGELEVIIEDEGDGFDHQAIREVEPLARKPRKSLNYFRENIPPHSVGYGIFDMLRLCDDVAWNDKGNKVIIRNTLQYPSLSKHLETISTVARKGWDYLYWDVYFTAGFSMMAGLGNALSSSGRFDHAFGEGFINNAKLGIFMNFVFPFVQHMTQRSANYRRNAHLVNTAMNLGFLAWHYAHGTENPLQAVIPCYTIGAVMSEQMSKELRQKA